MKIYPLIFLAFFFFHPFVKAEIEIVELKWVNPMWGSAFCDEGCSRLMEELLYQIPAVADVQVIPSQGKAVVRWKPNMAFQYQSLFNAISMLGLNLDTINITVRGTVVHDDATVSIVSIGDNTTFVLLSPIEPSRSLYVMDYSLATHRLAEGLRRRFLLAETQFEMVKVTGQLFEPERRPPLYLVVDKAEFQLDKQQR